MKLPNAHLAIVDRDCRHTGIKYIVIGRIETASGRSPSIRTVWIVDTGNDKPRLVTAYPGEEEDHDQRT